MENEPTAAKSGMGERSTEPTKTGTDKPRTVSQKEVLVAGSSRIQDDNYEQIKTLAKMIGAKIMQVDNWILLNGGASEKSSDGSLMSVDELVCIGAKDELRKYGDHKLEKEKILTLHPEKGDKPLHDIGNVEVDKGADPFLRRRHLAERADVIVTIEGGPIGTKEIVDYALKELKKPVLPISCTGGTSRKAWEDNESNILQTFGIENPSEDYEMLTTTKGLANIEKLSDVVIKITKDKLKQIPEDLRIGPSTHFTTDSWTTKDTLGYQAYAYAIASFITHKQTKWPLCISIQAPWGGGKTSLMRMIQEKLDPKAVEEFDKFNKDNADVGANMEDILNTMVKPDENTKIKIQNNQRKVKPLITVWFNAWKYESTEQVWSG